MNHKLSTKCSTCISEMFKPSNLKNKKCVQNYVSIDKENTLSYINDIEETLNLNEDLLNHVIDSSENEDTIKRVLLGINKKNTLLLERYKQISIERNNLQYKLLISEQIIDSLKISERNLEKLHKQYHKAKELLKKYSNTDQNIKKLLYFTKNNITKKNHKSISTIDNCELKQDNNKGHKKNPSVPRLNFSKLNMSSIDNTQVVNLTETIVQLTNEIKNIKNDNKKLHELNSFLETKNKNLLILNNNINESLQIGRAHV